MTNKIAFLFFSLRAILISSQDYHNSGTHPILKSNYGYGLNPQNFGFKVNRTATNEDIQRLLKSYSQSHKSKDPKKYCKSFETCSECIKSTRYPCVWCHEYGCTSKKNYCLHSSREIRVIRNVSWCPYIQSKGPIVMSSGTRKHIVVKINISEPVERDVICQLKTRNGMLHIKGVILNGVVYCHPAKVVILDGIESGTFNIVWGGVQPFSNGVPLVVYRCDLLASDCDTCRMIPREYDCGWCDYSQKCSLVGKCNDLVSWSQNRESCQTNKNNRYFD